MTSRLIFLIQAVARNGMWPGTWSKDVLLVNLFWMSLNTFYLTCFLIECVFVLFYIKMCTINNNRNRQLNNCLLSMHVP